MRRGMDEMLKVLRRQPPEGERGQSTHIGRSQLVLDQSHLPEYVPLFQDGQLGAIISRYSGVTTLDQIDRIRRLTLRENGSAGGDVDELHVWHHGLYFLGRKRAEDVHVTQPIEYVGGVTGTGRRSGARCHITSF